jgi:VWFA-related protein
MNTGRIPPSELPVGTPHAAPELGTRSKRRLDVSEEKQCGGPAGFRQIVVCCSIFLCCVVLLCEQLAAGQAEQKAAQDSAAKIAVKVDSVLIPVLVRDKQGRALGNLKKEDFQLFDRGKKQTISGFSIQARAGIASDTKADLKADPAVVSGSAPQPTRTPQAAPHRFVVFLFDDMHLNASELMQIQQAATRMIAASLAESDMAGVLSISGSNSGLTQNREILKEAIAKLHEVNLYRHTVHECPDISYYEADLIQNKHDYAALETAMANAATCANLAGSPPEVIRRMVEGAALRALAIGDQDVRVTLGFIRAVVHKMSSLSGERTLILVSPGFLTITQEAIAEKSEILDLAAQSDVTISALDARGLYSGQIDASERGGSSARALQSGSDSQYRRDSMRLNEDVMAELADGSGGTYFHNSNDLQGGFQQLVAAPEYVYLLELSLQNVKRDGAYHRVTVKVDQDGVTLRAREGYFAPKAAKDRK